MSRWIYKVHPLKYGQNPLNSENEINFLANEGWEVLTVYNNPGAVVLLRKRFDGVYSSEVFEEDSSHDIPEPVKQNNKTVSEAPSLNKEDVRQEETAKSFYARGSAKLANGMYEEAIQEYDKAVDLDPSFRVAYMFRANAKLKLRQFESAITDFDKALELKSGDLPCLLNRGICKFEIKQYEKAVEDFNEVLEIDSKNVMAYEYRGMCKKQMKLYEEAISDFSKILLYDSSDVHAYTNRAETRLDMEDYEGAIADYDSAAKIDSTNAMVYYKRAQAKKINGDSSGFKSDMKIYKEMCTRILASRSGGDWGKDEVHGNEDDDELKLID